MFLVIYPTREQIRFLILYEFKLKHNASEASRNICMAYPDAITPRVCQQWFAKFKERETDLRDSERSGHPTIVDNEALRTSIEADPNQTTRVLAQRFCCGQSVILRYLQEIGKVYKLGKWIPHQLSNENRQQRVTICSSLLSRLKVEPFIERIITGDEKWVLYVNVKRRGQWIEANQRAKPTAKPELHPKKVMLSIWWDIKGVVYFELLDDNQTITADIYCQQLDKLHQKLTTQRPALLNRKGVILQFDNARSHVARITQQKIIDLGWEVLPHPAYSPDIAPSDYHIFRDLQCHLNGKEFNSKEEVVIVITKFFQSKPPNYYRNGIKSLPDKWSLIVQNNGEYIID